MNALVAAVGNRMNTREILLKNARSFIAATTKNRHGIVFVCDRARVYAREREHKHKEEKAQRERSESKE